MKHQRILKTMFLMCLVSILSSNLHSQSTSVSLKQVFPAGKSEFTVEFPRAPKIQTVYTDGANGKQAQLELTDCFLRAEVLNLTDEQVPNFVNISESQRVSIALAYARTNGLSNPTVTAGVNLLGRYVKLRGYKVIEGINVTYEGFFIWGYEQAFSLTVGGKSSGYPQTAITAFLNSVKSTGQAITARKIDISVSHSRILLNSSSVILPIQKNELFKVLGLPNRESAKMNTIYTWDQYGLLAYERPGSGMINQVSVVINNVDMNYAFWPRRTFSGRLTVDDTPIVSETTSSGLNQLRDRRPFVKTLGLSFLRELELGNLKITAGWASETKYSEDGKLVEVSIQATGDY